MCFVVGIRRREKVHDGRDEVQKYPLALLPDGLTGPSETRLEIVTCLNLASRQRGPTLFGGANWSEAQFMQMMHGSP